MRRFEDWKKAINQILRKSQDKTPSNLSETDTISNSLSLNRKKSLSNSCSFYNRKLSLKIHLFHI